MSALAIRGTITSLAGAGPRTSIDVHGWTGRIPDLKNDADRYQRPGADGGGTQTIGRSAMAEIVCWRAEVNMTAAQSTMSSLEDLQNVVCKMKDGWGLIKNRVRVISINVTPVPCRGPNITGGSVATVILFINMRVERLPDG